MSRYRPQRRLREEERMAGVMPAARQLGEALGGDPWCRDIPQVDRVTSQPARLTNWRAWGFPSKAAMDEAFYGDDHD